MAGGDPIERSVRGLQERIFRASQNGEPAKVKNLQKLLVRSSSAKLLAIRKGDPDQSRQEDTGPKPGSSRWVLDADIAKCLDAAS